jgi:hypothetical protein
MAGCRDCSRCTESAFTSLLLSIPRLILAILFRWNIGLFQRYCPTCGHRMALHARRADGSFKD